VFLTGVCLSSHVIDYVIILYRVGSYGMAMIYSNMIMKKEFIRVSHGTTYLGHRNWGEDMKNLPG
jgi:RNA-splicing ligase RtcB